MLSKNKEEMEQMDINTIAQHFCDLRDELKICKDATSVVQKEFDLCRKIVIPDKMEDLGFDSVNIAGLGRLSLRSEMYASILADKKPQGYAWLEENGHGDLIKETVNASSLKALLKEQIALGELIPDDIFTCNPYLMATITKT